MLKALSKQPAWQRPTVCWSRGLITQAGIKSTGRIKRLAAPRNVIHAEKQLSERGQGTVWEESKINSSTKKTKTLK